MDPTHVFSCCASQEEARGTYRFLAKRFHPDHGGANADMVKVNLAYEATLKRLEAEKAASGSSEPG